MNTKKIISIISVFLLMAVTVVSCVKDTDYELPSMKVEVPAFDGQTVTFAEALAASSATLQDYTENQAIEGYVVSSDEGGNFYKKLYVQNADQTDGVSVAIDKNGLYADYPVGSKIQIRLKGLSTQVVNGKLEIGYGTYTNAAGTRTSVGNMPSAIQKTTVYNLGEPLKTIEELAKASTSVDALKINDNVNLMVTFKNVSFEPTDIGKEFHLSANDNYYGTDYSLVDADGKKVIFRTSRYANFAKETVPAGILEVTGVLTKYNSSYQFMINNTNDIKVVGSGNNSGGGSTTGTVISTFPYSESFAASSTSLPSGWSVINTKGTFEWRVGVHSSNNVNRVRMSAYNANGTLDVISWLITPKINLDVNTHVLKVKIADAFQNGNPLKVKYSTNYSGSGSPDAATWTEIGASQIAALINNTATHDNNYEESAAIPLPLTGEVYIAFVYESGGNISTTIDLQSVYIGADSGSTPTPNPTPVTGGEKSVLDIRNLFTSTDVEITEDTTIKVIVTSDKSTNNLNAANAFAQDATAGIALRFAAAADNALALGEEVTLNLKGAKITKFRGLIQIEGLTASSIISKTTATVPTPKVITITEALTGNYESQLVSISGVQFKTTGETYNGNKLVTDCTNELTVFTRSQATFAGSTVSDKNGTITGVLSNYDGIQLILRTESDVDFAANYNDCSGNTTPTPNPTPNPTPGTTGKFDFEDMTKTGTGYNSTEVLTATDGTKLTYLARADISGYEIDGKGVMLRRANDNGYIKLEFANSVTKMTFQVRGAFTGTAKRIIAVMNGDENSTAELERKEFDYAGTSDTTIHTFTVDLSTANTKTVTLKLGTAAAQAAQVVFDNISWE
ncbi:MAG: DUF5689 domain-containing protein [Capnocytophaga sp.]|nr:DUF5689 domain-containing protein [Capnocytophaga sp.]